MKTTIKSKFRKSSTPPSQKHVSYSPSSGGESSSGDDFPLFRPNFLEKSPSTPCPVEKLQEIDDLLVVVRKKLQKLL